MGNDKVLVTGGCGFIGKHLCKRLVEMGKDVTVLDIAVPQNGTDNGCNMVKGDIRDTSLVEKLMRNVDTVYHLAAVTTFQECLDDPDKALHVNVYGTATLLQAAVRQVVGSFVFFSSASVYSGNKNPVKREDMPLAPTSLYGKTKLMGERLCESIGMRHGTPCAVLRPFNVYGDGGRGVINKFAGAVKGDRCIVIRGGGSQTRDYIHVDDVVQAAVANGEGRYLGAFNVGTGKGNSILELKAMVEQLSGVTLSVKWLPREPWDLRELIADVNKGILPSTTSLGNGLSTLLGQK